MQTMWCISRIPTTNVPTSVHDVSLNFNAQRSDEERTEIKASLFTSLPRNLILCHAIWTRDFGDRTEEEMAAIWKPVYPFQFCDSRNSLQGLVSCFKDSVVGLVLRLEVLGSGDLKEALFDDAEEYLTHWLGTVYCTVEVPVRNELVCKV